MDTHQAGTQGAAGRPAPPGRRVLRDEVLLVLGLSLASSALYALVDLLSAPISGVEAPLFADVGLAYQLLNIGTSAVPVALVLHLLGRSGESAASIGLDARRPLADLRWGVGLPPWSAPSASASTSWPSASASTARWCRSPPPATGGRSRCCCWPPPAAACSRR